MANRVWYNWAMKFSLIVTAHDEGMVVEATLTSVFRAVEFWREKSGASEEDFEILVLLDRGTEETRECLRGYTGKVRVIECDFGDVGPARNYAASEAWGEYVFFVDGDDLVSRGYVDGALKILETAEDEIVVCPEYCIGFSEDGRTGSVLRMAGSGREVGEIGEPREGWREHDAFLLFNINLWVMAIAGQRKTFLEHRYIRSENGYGHEDYAMNIELTAAGVRHEVVPGEVYFYREKTHSRRTWNDERKATEPYSELFAPEFWRTFPAIEKQRRAGVMGRLKKLYLSVRQNKAMRALAESVRGAMSKKIVKELPQEVLEEWGAIAEIEPIAGKSVRKGSSAKRFEKKINAMGAGGVNKYCPASDAYLLICREYGGFSGVDFEKHARGLDAEQRDLLMSRIMVQSRGKARFLDDGCLKEWKKIHPELAENLEIDSLGER